LKGSEERDLLFGKLFGYLSIVQSGKLQSDKEHAEDIMTRLIELHGKKGWIREVVCEGLLALISVVDLDIAAQLVGKFKPLLTQPEPVPISEMTAWQLMLAIGLQQYGKIITKAAEKHEKQDKQDKQNDAKGNSKSDKKSNKHDTDSEHSKEAVYVESIVRTITKMLPEEEILTPRTLESMRTTLLAATGGFPKLHRVWDFILGGVFSMDRSRNLPLKR
jgi:DNA-directed RNA polymerase delta subunit